MDYNASGVLLNSAVRTTTASSDVKKNRTGKYLHVIIDVSAGTGFGLTPTIEAPDPAVDGEYYPLLIGTKIAATGRTVLKIGPGLAPSSGASAADMVPAEWRVTITPDDTTEATYSVSYYLGGA